MNPIYEIKNGCDDVPGTTIDLSKLLYVGRVNSSTRYSKAFFSIEQAGNAKYSEITPGGDLNLDQHRADLIDAWNAYHASLTSTGTKRHQRHRIEKGDNHAILDLYEVLYIGALMELSDGKHGFPIVLRSTGMPINVSFDRESEAVKAHVALDNAYGDYLNNLNQQGV